MEVKTAATIDVIVPENRKLELELPPEVPAGKAKLLVMVEEQPDEAALLEAHLVEQDGFLLIETPSEVSFDDFEDSRGACPQARGPEPGHVQMLSTRRYRDGRPNRSLLPSRQESG